MVGFGNLASLGLLMAALGLAETLAGTTTKSASSPEGENSAILTKGDASSYRTVIAFYNPGLS